MIWPGVTPIVAGHGGLNQSCVTGTDTAGMGTAGLPTLVAGTRTRMAWLIEVIVNTVGPPGPRAMKRLPLRICGTTPAR